MSVVVGRIVHQITPAKAHAWATCGGMFQARYLSGESFKESYASRLGTAVHELAVEYDRALMRGSVEIPELVLRHWRPGRFAGHEDAGAWAEATTLLTAYVSMRGGEDVEYVGGEIFLGTPSRSVAPGQGIALSGRLDRVARRRDGAIEVLDLKTSELLPTSDELRRDPATVIYHLLAVEHYDAPYVVIAQYSPRSGARVEVMLDDQDVEAGKDLLREMVRQLATQRFALTPSASCAYCQARASCPAVRGGDDLVDVPF